MGYESESSADLSNKSKEKSPRMKKLAAIIASPQYDLAVSLVAIINFIIIIIQETESKPEEENLIHISLIVNFILSLELILDICVNKYKAYSTYFRVWPETVC